MKMLAALAAALILATACLTAGLVNNRSTSRPFTVQGEYPAFQMDGPPAENPTFRAQARQILITAVVWDLVGTNNPHDESLFPKSALKRLPNALKDLPKHLPVPVRGLIAKDFRLLDNDAEQKINYVKESVVALDPTSPQWDFVATNRGTWGFPPIDAPKVIHIPTTVYLIGYVPPSS